MANPTTNYGFVLPQSSDLVTDLPADFDIALQGVDTRLKALQPGTTLGDLAYSSATANTNTRLPIGSNGQVLAVSGGVPAWTTTADVTPLTTKGDLFTFTTVDARLAVGNNGESLVADSSTATGLRYQADFAAGKNKVINGDFLVNQRAFTSSTSAVYGFDRWVSGLTGGTVTYSAQTFTPGAAPVAGYEAVNFARLVTSGQSATADYAFLAQRIEDCRTFANQTVTVSFWAKANSGTPKVGVCVEQALGASFVQTPAGNPTITTSWARYSVTVAVPSLAGKTLGAANATSLNLYLFTSAGASLSAYVGSLGVQNTTIDFWGVQIEAGSVATAFQTATGTIQGELAACQRYYYRQTAAGTYSRFYLGNAGSTTVAQFVAPLPVTMRTSPTALDTGGSFRLYDLANAPVAVTSFTIIGGTETSPPNIAGFTVNTASGLTAVRSYTLTADGSATAYLGFSAEL